MAEPRAASVRSAPVSATLKPERLVVDNLSIAFDRGQREVVRSVSFEISPGQALGLIGESGSGKTLTCRAILGLLPPGTQVRGRIHLGAISLLELPEKKRQRLRGSTIAMVFQDPLTALNPVLRVGDAIAQVIRSHEESGHQTAKRRAVEMMERVGIHDADRRSRSYPHEFSGGMRQRIVIAMALASRPTLLLADEPTTALDVIVQAGILRLLDELRREDRLTLLLVSHDFGVVSGLCDRVGVMYHGQLVEEGLTDEVLSRPRHPYTIGLIDSLPTSRSVEPLRPIPGSPPVGGAVFSGCSFAPRCPIAAADCEAAPIEVVQVADNHGSRCIHTDRLDEITRLRAQPRWEARTRDSFSNDA